jgi:sugar/nucleoside kinase (ribokinase family)
MKHIDVLAVGETMIDLISETELPSLGDARTFILYPGGEIANVASNVACLGGSSAVVARVGDDSFGLFLRNHLVAAGVETRYLQTTLHTSTTLAVVARQTETPDFVIYRGADACLVPDDMPVSLLGNTSLVHTSAFALSREPSSSTIIEFVKKAHESGCLVSFDPNYHPRLWYMHDGPLAIFEKICPFVSIIKPSFDDCERLFGESMPPETYTARFLAMGVQQVILTMGSDGVLFADAKGMHYFPNKPVRVVDVTGAGDSFWSGLLLATLDGYAITDAIRVGQAVAEIKLQQVGPLSHAIDRHALYTQLGIAKTD